MKKFKLKELAAVDFSGVDKKSKPSEKTVLLCNFVDVYHNWAITEDMEPTFMVATATEKETERFILKKGQVALTKDSETRDDIGISTYIADNLNNTILGYHNALITPDEKKLSGKYLNAYFHSSMAKTYFSNNASGSGQRYALSVDTINDFQIYLPDIENQKRIGNLFSFIDRKIALNRAINRNLEAMAKRLYDYWFVQFDFPDENGRPYKTSGGKMVWNETLKRDIPDGWEVKSIFEAADVLYGFPFSTEPFDEENLQNSSKPYSVIRIRDIANNTISAKTDEFVDSKYQTEINDLIIGMDGYFHMNFWPRKGDYVNQRIVRIRKKNISSFIIYHQIKPYIKHIEEKAKGSTVGHLSDKDMKQLHLLIPKCNNLSIRFENCLNLMSKNKTEILKLENLRDRLLPLLMNGQVEVRE